MTSTALFEIKAPPAMTKLMSNLNLDLDSAASIMGNVGVECDGFHSMQEIKPLVPGSRGGYGWCMWTGPRRKHFEQFCKKAGLDPASDEANLSFLLFELEMTEKRSVTALKIAVGLPNKVAAFCNAFERPAKGLEHYHRRTEWAEIAKSAYLKEYAPKPQRKPVAAKTSKAGQVAAGGTAAAGGAVIAVSSGVEWYWIAAVIAAAGIAAGIWWILKK